MKNIQELFTVKLGSKNAGTILDAGLSTELSFWQPLMFERIEPLIFMDLNIKKTYVLVIHVKLT